MHGRTRSLQHPSRKDETGFTLIELLVVITILGILAAIVVFAVKGIGDKGKSASVATDLATLRTAEEAHCANLGSYADAAHLVTDKYLLSQPTYSSIVLGSGGNCGTGVASSFVAGSTSSVPTAGELVLAASNTTPPFSFLSSSAPDPVTLTFGASSTLAGTSNARSNASLAVLFASADEANVNATIATGDPVNGNGSAGTCTSSCLGIGATKRLYAIGRLVAFQCASGGKTLTPALNAPTCKLSTPAVTTSATTVADIVNQLQAHTTAPKYVLTIAEPCPTGSSGCTSHHPPTDGSAPNAPYGVAAYEALTSSGTGGGGLTQAAYDTLVANGQIIFGSNVTNTQNNVTGGTAQFALLPESFVKSPGGNDTDPWTEIDSSLHNPIKQYAVVLNHTSTTTAKRNVGRTFLNYVGSPAGQSVMAAFGYASIGTYTPVAASDVP